jgi:hypothetical protein
MRYKEVRKNVPVWCRIIRRVVLRLLACPVLLRNSIAVFALTRMTINAHQHTLTRESSDREKPRAELGQASLIHHLHSNMTNFTGY